MTMRGGAIHLILVAVLAPAGCQPAVDLELSRKFQQAQADFDRAQTPDDYLRVANLYQEIIDAGVVSGALLYNQGNALMRAGSRGRAVACYRKAQRYRPRDPYLDANLRFALATEGARPASRSILDHLLFWQNWLAYPDKFRLTAGAALLAFGLGVAALYVRRRRLCNRLALVALSATLLLAFSAAYDWYRFVCVEHGVVIRDGVVARKGNAESYEAAFTEPLAEATEFQVVERRGGWILIRLAAAQEGWVEQDDVVTF